MKLMMRSISLSNILLEELSPLRVYFPPQLGVELSFGLPALDRGRESLRRTAEVEPVELVEFRHELEVPLGIERLLVGASRDHGDHEKQRQEAGRERPLALEEPRHGFIHFTMNSIAYSSSMNAHTQCRISCTTVLR